MLGDKEATTTIAVKNLDAAKKFYEDTLGLKAAGGEEQGGILYQSGPSKILVYESAYAGSNKATALSWNVGNDVEAVIQALKAKGVQFEQYDDLPGVTRQGDVHLMGGMKTAWFKDPDGNILNIGSE